MLVIYTVCEDTKICQYVLFRIQVLIDLIFSPLSTRVKKGLCKNHVSMVGEKTKEMR